MDLRETSWKLTGLSSLLMNNPKAMGLKPPKPGEAIDEVRTKKEMSARFYELPDGQLYVPAEAVRKSWLWACGNHKFKNKSFRTIAQGSIVELEEYEHFRLFRSKDEQPITADDAAPDVRRVVIGKAAIMRIRPKVSQWQCTATFAIDYDRVDIDKLTEILNDAGAIIGLLDYRPAKGGTFGRFLAELIEN